MEQNIFIENWEDKLALQFLKNNRCCKKAYICSPLSAPTEEEMLRNMHSARAYMYYAMEKMGYAARAPHAYLPMLLCDRVPSERAIALQFGLHLLEESDLILVCGNHISNGMREEILHAITLNMPIYTFEESLYLMVQKLATQHNGNKSQRHQFHFRLRLLPELRRVLISGQMILRSQIRFLLRKKLQNRKFCMK